MTQTIGQPVPEIPQAPVPQFEAPKPGRSQEMAMRLAGCLLTAGDPQSPNVTLEALITDVGGFRKNGQNTGAGQDPNSYSHEDAKTQLKPMLRDETTKVGHSVERRPVTSSDHSDLKGTTNREDALARTVSGDRARSGLGLRKRAARRLVRHATKGVGSSPYSKR
ncbi:hypothetical protein KC960_02040 [Candidatus Saccharibacteria bacterium]|nr:hypothetical protein [Candidatus Saccharibacteria bacterium]